MPDMDVDEMLDITQIYSLLGMVDEKQPLICKRPFRNPHHSCSAASLIGGGSFPKPGEISLAHRGVLFLDEFPEFKRDVLESLRQPLEDGVVTVSRARRTLKFPSSFLLVAAMNPCPCGFLGSNGSKTCRCSSYQIQKYQAKISGPLLDRIDIQIEVPSLGTNYLTSDISSEDSQSIKKRVERARQIQRERFKRSKIKFNSQMQSKDIKKYCFLSIEVKKLLSQAIEELGMSARVYDKVIKISRSIADLKAQEQITTTDISEALNYRSLDNKLWN